MATSLRFDVLVLAAAVLLGLSACGSEGPVSASAASTAIDDDHGHSHDGDGHGGHDDNGHDGNEHDGNGHDDHDGHDGHDDKSAGGLNAHEHGAAKLSVGLNEGEMVIDLISPTHNIFGFEYEASTDEEKKLVADRTEALSAPDNMAINSEAGCNLSGDVLTKTVAEGSHSEITVSWTFGCDKPEKISQLDTAALFSEFPNLEDIDAEWASASAQSSAELSSSSPILKLK